jgi:flavin reductase (DIM6/NTAB) family NADH-FMN oxidoreductase RutF
MAAPVPLDHIHRALDRGRGCTPLLTSRFADKRSGLIATSAQVCGSDPALVCIAARKGHHVDLLMRDSQHFALCFIPSTDRLLLRRFDAQHTPDARIDPFDGMEMDRLTSGAPIFRRAVAALDCQIFRMVDLETDHELIIGSVLALRITPPALPHSNGGLAAG